MPQFDEIGPSHADLPIPPDTIQKLHEGAKEILAGKVQGEPEELHGQSIVAYDLGLCTMLCDKESRKVSSIQFLIKAYDGPMYPMLNNFDTDSSRNNQGRVWSTRRNHLGWKGYLRAEAKMNRV